MNSLKMKHFTIPDECLDWLDSQQSIQSPNLRGRLKLADELLLLQDEIDIQKETYLDLKAIYKRQAFKLDAAKIGAQVGGDLYFLELLTQLETISKSAGSSPSKPVGKPASKLTSLKGGSSNNLSSKQLQRLRYIMIQHMMQLFSAPLSESGQLTKKLYHKITGDSFENLILRKLSLVVNATKDYLDIHGIAFDKEVYDSIKSADEFITAVKTAIDTHYELLLNSPIGKAEFKSQVKALELTLDIDEEIEEQLATIRRAGLQTQAALQKQVYHNKRYHYRQLKEIMVKENWPYLRKIFQAEAVRMDLQKREFKQLRAISFDLGMLLIKDVVSGDLSAIKFKKKLTAAKEKGRLAEELPAFIMDWLKAQSKDESIFNEPLKINYFKGVVKGLIKIIQYRTATCILEDKYQSLVDWDSVTPYMAETITEEDIQENQQDQQIFIDLYDDLKKDKKLALENIMKLLDTSADDLTLSFPDLYKDALWATKY